MRKIDEALFKIIEDYLTIRGEGGTTKPDNEDIIGLHDAIYDHYRVKELQHFKDASIGLHCTDKDPALLLELFNNSQSDAHSIECGEFEQVNEDWKRYIRNENYFKSPFFQLE